MKLAHKNFLYTTIVTGILTVIVLVYFVLMLPSLYVDHMSKKNYDIIVNQHTTYLEDRSYQNIEVNNPSCMSIEIPFDKAGITVSGKAFQLEILPATEKMQLLTEEIKSYIGNSMDAMKESNKNTKDFSPVWEEKIEEWKNAFIEEFSHMEQVPITFAAQFQNFEQLGFTGEITKLHFFSNNTIIMETGASDTGNHYTSFLAFTYDNDELIASFFPAMTPYMNEIFPIITHSLPMLIAVIILFALIVSYLYSKGMVSPILKLVRHTENVKNSGITHYTALDVTGRDEIAELTVTLNELYQELSRNYLEMEQKNRELDQKNKRQEVFLKSCSHQLKTPIAAALLLVNGMMNQIGKYQDVQAYLPQVKKQLLSMQKMVQDILYLTRCEENLYKEKLQVSQLLSQSISNHEVSISAGGFQLITDFSKECYCSTDAHILMAILDNLISNAIAHSKEGASITIKTSTNEVMIENSPAHIPEDLLPNIFEPFVSNNGKGHGLGLYIVAYYAELLGAKIQICNGENAVKAKLIFY